LEPERAKKIDALARTLHDYLRPLGTTEGMEDRLRYAIKVATRSGLELAQQIKHPVASTCGCRPGDDFDPRFMTAKGMPAGSDKESKLVEAGGRVAMVLSPPFLIMWYENNGNPAWDVETADIGGLSDYVIRKAEVICYTMKEDKDNGKFVEISGIYGILEEEEEEEEEVESC